MVQMGRRFWIEKWVIDGYKSLTLRGRPYISDEEMLEIGPVAAFQLMRLREERITFHGSGGWKVLDVDAAIRKVFSQELTSIAAEENKCESVEMLRSDH